MSEKIISGIELLLSVELWQEIFEYFNASELWYSFRALNRRIDAILEHIILHLNFETKDNYCYFMKNNLSKLNVTNIQSLKFQEVVQLRSLSLNRTYSSDNNSLTFWDQLSSLKYLRSLKIMLRSNCFGQNNCIEEKDFILRSIFHKDYCPLLEYFSIITSGRQREVPANPPLNTTIRATNIKYFLIDSLAFDEFVKLFPALQNMTSFNIDYQLHFINEQQQQQTCQL